MSTLAMLSFFLGICYLARSFLISKRLPYDAKGKSYILSVTGVIVRIGLILGAAMSFMLGSYMLGIDTSHHPAVFRILGALTIDVCCWIVMWSILLEYDIGIPVEKWIKNKVDKHFNQKNMQDFFFFISLFIIMLLLVAVFTSIAVLLVSV